MIKAIGKDEEIHVRSDESATDSVNEKESEKMKMREPARSMEVEPITSGKHFHELGLL